jgi:TetR/AcrR family transcriptional regulator of autoinduction and epiphytic fitness
MAQRSKKDFIIETALPLFIEHGYKATSIDLVVKTCGVSKPTVYNHFPDKAALMLAVMQSWTENNQPEIKSIRDIKALKRVIKSKWLKYETVCMYALVIGEGRRFVDAKILFWRSFDDRWRQALLKASQQEEMPADTDVHLYMEHYLFENLKQL